jgi:hypothetical protein
MSSLPKPLGQPWFLILILALVDRFDRPGNERYTKDLKN